MLVYLSNKNSYEEKHRRAKVYFTLAFAEIFGLVFVILDRGPAALAGLNLGQTAALALLVLAGVFLICAVENNAELSLEQKTREPADS